MQPDIPTRIIDGVECTTRDGIAVLAGWPRGNSAHVNAGKDPNFPSPLEGRYDRRLWYPLNGVREYIEKLNARRNKKKPKPVPPGDPDEMLNSRQAAEAMRIAWSTFRKYVALSQPFWTGHKEGRPMVPKPDEPGEHPKWRRGTIAAHQDNRPGKGG